MVEKDKVALVGDKSGNLDPERRNQRASTSSKHNPKHGFEFEYKSSSEHLVHCHASTCTVILVHVSPLSNMTTFCVRVCYSMCVCVLHRMCDMVCLSERFAVYRQPHFESSHFISDAPSNLIAYFRLYLCVCVCVMQTYPMWTAFSLSPLLPRVDSATALQELVRHHILIFGRR